jgi:hypothetical protein
MHQPPQSFPRHFALRLLSDQASVGVRNCFLRLQNSEKWKLSDHRGTCYLLTEEHIAPKVDFYRFRPTLLSRIWNRPHTDQYLIAILLQSVDAASVLLVETISDRLLEKAASAAK